MIKQDFYIANLIARYLSEEITPEETIKLTTWREESTAHKSNISGKIRHSILHPDGKKWKSESKEIITEADISK